MYIMCVILRLFSALSRWVGALQISIIIIIIIIIIPTSITAQQEPRPETPISQRKILKNGSREKEKSHEN